jgi:hypothetical protein
MSSTSPQDAALGNFAEKRKKIFLTAIAAIGTGVVLNSSRVVPVGQ